MAEDWEARDFFTDGEIVADPYPYYEAMRGQCPVHREPHQNVLMVTGYDEAVEVFHDSGTFSSCIAVTGPFPGFPVPLDGLGGDEVRELIGQHRHELPFNDQLPVLDPPEHTGHRALLMKLITPKRLKENEDAMGRLADQVLDGYLTGGAGDFISGFAGPFTLLVIADLLGRAGDHGPAAQLRRPADRRGPLVPGAAAPGPGPAAELHRRDPADGEPGQGRLPAGPGAGRGRRGGRPRGQHADAAPGGGQPGSAPVRGPGEVPGRPAGRAARVHPGGAGARRGGARRGGARRGGAVKAVVDEDRCRGHGVCCALCPAVFELTDDGYSQVRVPAVPAAAEDAARDAAANCPERAITVS